jgi:hypothetical protein
MATGADVVDAGNAVPTVKSSADRRVVMNPSRSTRHETAISLDGSGAADHDQPYQFGRRPTASAPYPFSTREYARLLLLRGRVLDGEFYLDLAAETVE